MRRAMVGASALLVALLVVPGRTGLAAGSTSSTTVLTSSASPAALGQTVTLTATVSGSGGTPTGNVSFSEVNQPPFAIATLVAGVATATVALAGGVHTITASYGGDQTFSPSGTGLQQRWGPPAASRIGMTASPAVAPAGFPVTLQAIVNPNEFYGLATGSVTFFDGTSTLGSATLGNPLFSIDGPDPVAILTVSSLPAGSHSVTAVYSGDADLSPSTSAPVAVSIGPRVPTTVGVFANSLAIVTLSDRAVSFGMFVNGAGPQAQGPTGSWDVTEGGVTLVSGALASLGPTFLTLPTTLSVGTHHLSIDYQGDQTFAPSAAPLTIIVMAAAGGFSFPNVTVTGPPSTTVGQTATVTATVSPPSFGPPPPGTPTGTVTFLDNGAQVGVVPLDAAGRASVTFTPTGSGFQPDSVDAVYGGDANFHSGLGELRLSLQQIATSTQFSVSANPVAPGQAITLTAHIAPAAAFQTPPSGLVAFLDTGVLVGYANVDAAGTAMLTDTFASAGPRQLEADYQGDGNYGSSQSAPITVNVTRAGTSLSISSSANPSANGQPVTFTADVIVSGTGSPTGTVTFMDGSTSLGAAQVAGAQASLTVATLTPGSHSITASYGGDANFLASTSASLTQVVQMKNAVTVALASDLNPSTAGQEVVFTATVTPMSPGQPRVRGTVTFRDGTTFLGRRGLDHDSVARLEVSSLDAGTHTITADYSGSGTFAPAVSAALLETVNAAPPELAVSQSDAAMLSP